MDIKRYKQTQRFRVIIDNASFYARAKEIRAGVGDFSKCNAAVQKALDALEYTRGGWRPGAHAACGIAGTWEGLNVQLDVA